MTFSQSETMEYWEENLNSVLPDSKVHVLSPNASFKTPAPLPQK